MKLTTRILDLHCTHPIARWEALNAECRIERLKPPPMTNLPEPPKPYRLHWMRMCQGPIVFERESRDFTTLDELYDWVRSKHIGPGRVQITLGI